VQENVDHDQDQVEYPICLECGERHPTNHNLRHYVTQDSYTIAELVRNLEMELNVPEIALVILGLESLAKDLPEARARVWDLTERFLNEMEDLD